MAQKEPAAVFRVVGLRLQSLFQLPDLSGSVRSRLVFGALLVVGVPLVLKKLIDALTISPTDPHALLVLPLGALVAYGALRFSTTLFTELREFLFARVTQRDG